MANPPIAPAVLNPNPPSEMNVLTDHIGTLVRANTAQGVNSVVKNFSGDPKHFKGWVKSIEKFSLITECEEGRNRYIALQTAEGAVADFIQRYLKSHPRSDWATMKRELSDRFGEVTDRAHARAILRTLRQRRFESPQMFCERLITASEDAFDRTDRNAAGELLPGIERILIDYFLDGIQDNTIKMKLLRESPTSLKRAVEIANSEQQLKARYQLRIGGTVPSTTDDHLAGHSSHRREEPMEVDATRFKGACFKCGHRGHKSTNCKAVRVVESNHKNVTCWECGKRGHYRAQCPRRGSNQ